MILNVHHFQVTIPEAQEPAARAFYVGVLGLKEIPKPKMENDRGGFWLELGSLQVHAGIDDERALTRHHIAYEVSDMDAIKAKLEAANIKLIYGSVIPGMERFQCRDPFGNLMEFVKLLK